MHIEATSKERVRKRSTGESSVKEKERGGKSQLDKILRGKEGDKLKGKESHKERKTDQQKRENRKEDEKRKITEREKPNAVKNKKKPSPSSQDRDGKKSSSVKATRPSGSSDTRKVEEKEEKKSEDRDDKQSDTHVTENSEINISQDKRSPQKEAQHTQDNDESVSNNQEETFSGNSSESSSSSSSSSSSESLKKMVHQSTSSSNGGAGGERGDIARGGGGSQTDLTEAERAEVERRERIQRYKDERRKQIAARYGTAEWSSSEESEAGDETSSYKSYRRRRRGHRDSQDASADDSHSKSQEKSSASRGRGVSSEEGLTGVRTTRVNRLRNAGRVYPATRSKDNNNSDNTNNNNNSNNNDNGKISLHEKAKEAKLITEGVGDRGRSEASPELTPGKRPPDQSEVRGNVGIDSADSTTLSGSDGRSGRRRTSGEERDKSSKRKSNLNRSTTTEEATSDPYALPHPSDSNEDTPRRRRRRAPVSPASSSLTTVGTSEPLKTPEVVRHVVSRLTPPTSPPIQPTPTPTRPQQSEQSVHLSNTFQPIHPASSQVTHSAPSTLDSRSRSSDETCRLSVGYGERQERSETDEILRKVPPKLAPLRKPDIPDVLRPKESATVASPGVVNTPPNSRPSSVVLEKPPLAPEGLRPATFRSSLRKPETGTCFMAARREKRDDIKPEFYREIQPKPKKGDRLSKSDMNLKMDSNFAGKVSDTSSVGEEKFEACGATSSPTLPTSNSSAIFSEEMMSSRLEALTARARDTLKRADRLIEDVPPPLPENGPPEDSADNVVHECQQYLTVNANIKESNPRIHHRELNLGTESSSDNLQTLPAIKGIISDTGQKNGVGGSEGHGKESKRMAMEKEMSKEMKRDPFQSSVLERNNIAFAVPSGPPKQSSVTSDHISSPKEEVLHGAQQTRYWDNEMGAHDTSVVRSSDSTLVKSPDHNESKWGSQRCSLDGDNSRTNSPDPLSILKRKSSREDLPNTDRPPTPEPHSILKRKTSSRNSSIDIHEGDPKPILKKKKVPTATLR